MTTSGSTDWVLNRNQIIAAALRKLRVYDASTTIPAGDITTGAEALNMMLKGWQNDDIKLWTSQQAVLHLAKNAQSYSLGSTGGHFCEATDAVKTQLTAAALASAATITVKSVTGIAAADKIGIQLADGTLHWDVVNGAPAGLTVTLTTGLASAANNAAYVFAYTTELPAPVQVLEARARDVNNTDIPILIEVSNNQYFQTNTYGKTATGICRRILVIPTIGDTIVYTWPICDDVTYRIFMTVQRVFEDFDASSDNPDCPTDCIEAMVYNLAVRLGPEYSKAVPTDVTQMAIYSYNLVKAAYGASDPVQFRPSAGMRWKR